LLSVRAPRKLKYTSDFGSIGLGFGSALGYCAADPKTPTVLFTGDGSLLMTLGELSTCVSEELPLIIVVMNDACLGAERHYLQLREMPVNKTLLPMIDFADLAAAFGYETATVTTMDELAALAPMLNERSSPILIDIKINPAVPAGFMAEFASKR
jgi:acetolactate synthase I/II/III large subunit